jgi:transposase
VKKGNMALSTNLTNGTDDGEPEGARRATGGSPSSRMEESLLVPSPDPEVSEKKDRRNFTAAYKLKILQEADKCTEPGQLGALLRREGLYSSNLTTWRRQRKEGVLDALSPKKRGRKEKEKNPLVPKVLKLERENERLRKQLKKAEIIIDVQKKISEILGISQEPTED